MSSSRVKGITVEIGGDTTKLDKALSGVDSNLYKIQKDLRAVESGLKLDPGNLDLLAQKERLLSESANESREKIEILSNALTSLEADFAAGKISAEEYRDQCNRVSLELNLAESSLNGTTRALKDLSVEYENAEMRAVYGEEALSDLRDAADDAGDEFEDMGDSSDELSGGLDGLKGVAAGAALEIGKKLVDAVVSAVEGTEELRIATGKLNAAFETAGYSAETAQRVFTDFYKLLGDTDTATEASQLLANMSNRTESLAYLTGLLSDEYGLFASNIPIDALVQAANEAVRTGEVTGALAEAIEQAGGSAESLGERLRNFDSGSEGISRLKLVTDELSSALFENSDMAAKASSALYEVAAAESSLAQWTNIAAGVSATFGDSLPIEGLIEAANETAKVGQVTGVLADALNWVGMSEDKMNESLAQLNDEGDRARLIMNNLSEAYSNAADAYAENNEATMQSREATIQFQQALAELAASAQPFLTTLTQLATTFLDWFNSIPDGAKAAVVGIGALLAVISPIAGIISAITGALAAAGLASTTFSIAGTAVSMTLSQWVIVIGVVVAAVLALAAAIAFLTGRSKELKNIEMPEVPNYSGAASSGGRSAYSMQTASAENVPYLAQGTVTRPNSPFMAVVGDNPTEPEIIAPYSTIKQATQDAIAESGGGLSAARVTVHFTGTMAQLVRQLQPQITVETQRLGPQFVK